MQKSFLTHCLDPDTKSLSLILRHSVVFPPTQILDTFHLFFFFKMGTNHIKVKSKSYVAMSCSANSFIFIVH